MIFNYLQRREIMNLLFSVNNPKIQKRAINRGEDAPVVNKKGIMIVCDGTGATGQSEHTLKCGENYTSAYLGSRVTSKIAEKFLSDNYDSFISAFDNCEELQKTVMRLGKSIQNGLNDFAKSNDLKLTVVGKSFKLLPTTLTAVVYKVYETKIEVILLSVGDSPALWWDVKGLHRLAAEDVTVDSLSFGDCRLNNCIAADSDFSIYFSCHKLPPKGILLACSDGFTDPIRPFEQEAYLIEWIGNFNGVSEQNSDGLSKRICEEMDDIGFTERDDCSIAGLIVGYSSEDELKDDFRKRYGSELVEPYIEKYQNLEQQHNQVAAELHRAKEVFRQHERKIIKVIKNAILVYLNDGFDLYSKFHEKKFNRLIDTYAVERKILEEDNRISSLLKKEQAEHDETKDKIKEHYLKFSKLLCCNCGAVRFSYELINVVRAFYKQKSLLKEHSNIIKSELIKLKYMNENYDEILSDSFSCDVIKASKKLLESSEVVNQNYGLYQNNKEIMEKYFNYSNKELEDFFNEDFENNFAILKKLPKSLASSEKKKLKLLSEQLLELNKTLTELKSRITDEFVKAKKVNSYRKIVIDFCEAVALELLENEKYQDFITEDIQKLGIPEWTEYEILKNQLKDILAQKNSVLDDYNAEYGKYLFEFEARSNIVIKRTENRI